MSRLVIVSNRVALPKEIRAGGLAAALHATLKERGGLWFGWSGKLAAMTGRLLHHESAGPLEYVLLDLTKQEYDAYYLGFANRTLWPLFHFQPAMMCYSHMQYGVYRDVNRRFAKTLAPLLREGDQIWIHDYHLIPLASELRTLGIGAKIGFFLHIPLPPPELLISLPCHADLMTALMTCDLVGVQTPTDAHAMFRYFVEVLGATRTGDVIELGTLRTRVAAFQVGIDTAAVARQSRAARDAPMSNLFKSLASRKLVIGVDRLDYSKGILRRFEAFDRFLGLHPDWRSRVSYLQIAPLSRQELPEYRELRRKLKDSCNATNRRYTDAGWMPVRCINRNFAQAVLAGLYRKAHLALVTPLRDGMNLVAKEFVAAQPPDDPGVLALSCFAGAAHELQQAVLVNPYDPDDLLRAIECGLSMSRDERRERWRSMYRYLLKHDVRCWSANYLRNLERL